MSDEREEIEDRVHALENGLSDLAKYMSDFHGIDVLYVAKEHNNNCDCSKCAPKGISPKDEEIRQLKNKIAVYEGQTQFKCECGGQKSTHEIVGKKTMAILDAIEGGREKLDEKAFKKIGTSEPAKG